MAAGRGIGVTFASLVILTALGGPARAEARHSAWYTTRVYESVPVVEYRTTTVVPVVADSYVVYRRTYVAEPVPFVAPVHYDLPVWDGHASPWPIRPYIAGRAYPVHHRTRYFGVVYHAPRHVYRETHRWRGHGHRRWGFGFGYSRHGHGRGGHASGGFSFSIIR